MNLRKNVLSLLVVAMALCALPAATAARSAAEGRTAAERSHVRLSAFGGHTCQVNGDGTARCWGLNGLGELGDGTTTNRSTPVRVSGLTNTVAVAAGGSHT